MKMSTDDSGIKGKGKKKSPNFRIVLQRISLNFLKKKKKCLLGRLPTPYLNTYIEF